MTDTALATVPDQPTGGALVTREHAAWTQEQRQLVRDLICPEAKEVHLDYFEQVAARSGLDPFAPVPEIHLMMTYKRGVQGKVPVCVVGVQGYRRAAEETGLFEGTTEAQWCYAPEPGQQPVWVDIWTDPDTPPYACKIGVYRKGWRDPKWGKILYHEFVKTKGEGKNAKPTGQWGEMPAHMLQVRAEVQALKAAFPLATRSFEKKAGVGAHGVIAPASGRPRNAEELWLMVLNTLAPAVKGPLSRWDSIENREHGVIIRFKDLHEHDRRVVEEAHPLLDQPTKEIAGRVVTWIFEFVEPAPREEYPPSPPGPDTGEMEYDEDPADSEPDIEPRQTAEVPTKVTKQQDKSFLRARDELGLSHHEAKSTCAGHLTRDADDAPTWKGSTFEQRQSAIAYLRSLVPPPEEPEAEDADYSFGGDQ